MESQVARLKQLKAARDNLAVASAIKKLKERAQGNDNLMPPIMEAVKCYATLGEICDTLREVFGEYRAVSTL
jgi:methylmalonyl-CoA mutase N-terminal domain/subunit